MGGSTPMHMGATLTEFSTFSPNKGYDIGRRINDVVSGEWEREVGCMSKYIVYMYKVLKA